MLRLQQGTDPRHTGFALRWVRATHPTTPGGITNSLVSIPLVILSRLSSLLLLAHTPASAGARARIMIP